MMEWISVKDKLPDVGVYVLIHKLCGAEKNFSFICFGYLNPNKTWSKDNDLYETTHWMPIPEPPNARNLNKDDIKTIHFLEIEQELI
jgi:hypothetical protein